MKITFTTWACIFFLQVFAQAADFFVTKDNLWFDQSDSTPVNAVIEIKGLYRAEVDLVLKMYLPPKLYKKLKIEILSVKPSVNRIVIPEVVHADLITLTKNAIPQLRRFGGHSLSPEIPLAVRVTGLEGHNDFIAEISGLPVKTISEIDRAAQKSGRTGRSFLIRYFLDDREKTDPADFAELKSSYGDAIVTHIPANTFGAMPLYVPGASVVFHSRSFHGASILGQFNPGLVNWNIAQALTANKFVEFLFWSQYAPDAIPETQLLSRMNLDLKNIPRLLGQLNRLFPEGWVMKGVNESSSNFSIITDKTDLVGEIRKYRRSDFEKFKDKTYHHMVGFDEDNIYEALQEHPNYFGWRASLYLQQPQNVIIQRKVAIDREFRVEAIGGKILKGATIDRHNWWLEWKGMPFEVSSPELIQRIEAYTQAVIDRLPAELRETNFAFDIALLKDGQFKVIESSAGSESGFLTNQGSSVVALNHFLKSVPQLKNRGVLSARGLSSEDQMKYLNDRFRLWEIDPAVQYSNYTFARAEVQTQFKPVVVDARFKKGPFGLACRQLFGL